MGYTHYWCRLKELDAETFARASKDCRKVCVALGIPLGDGEGVGVPEFSQEVVSFNGAVDSGHFAARCEGLLWPGSGAEGVARPFTEANAGKRSLGADGDGSYETFYISQSCGEHGYESSPGVYSAFCKTNYRPYDLAVQCCLIVFKEHFGPSFCVHSDGDSGAWKEPSDACQVFLGYGLDFALDAACAVPTSA